MIARIALAVLVAPAADAAVLEFEGELPGPPAGTFVEGDFTITSPRVEPLGSLCPTPNAPPCPVASSGQYLAAVVGETISIARTDGAPFDLESVRHATSILNPLIAVTGTTSAGATVSQGLVGSPTFLFETSTFPDDFDAVVSVAFEVPFGALNFFIDTVTISEPVEPPPPPLPTSGTPGTMQLLDDARLVEASGRSCVPTGGGFEDCGPFEDLEEAPTEPFALFSSALSAGQGAGAASQSGIATTGELSATGGAAGIADLSGETSTNGTGRSVYDVRFRLTQASRISVEGTMSSEDTSGLQIGFEPVRLRLTRFGQDVYAVDADTGAGVIPLLFDGVLQPGHYRLRVEADGSTWVQALYDFQLFANPVPNVPFLPPGALLVLLGGLVSVGTAALATRRRQ